MADAAVQQFDAERAEAYDDRIRRLVPDYDGLQDTVTSVLASRLGREAHLLVVGAGTGEEILTMGTAHPQWRFTAVDPSPDMLDRCRTKVAEAGLDTRVEYVCDRMEAASPGSRFDAATALFVAHFLQEEAAKHRFFQSIAEHLVPGAPFVWADLYRPASDTAARTNRAAWRQHLRRRGMEEDEVARTFDRIDEGISFVREPTLKRLASDGGFTQMYRFYQHFLWGAWVAQAA